MAIGAARDPINCVERRVEYKLGSQDPNYCTVHRVDETTGHSLVPEAIIRYVPEVISAHDRVVVEKLRKRAYEMEQSNTFMGIKVGSTAGIGIIPAIGPLVNFYSGKKLIKLVDELEGTSLDANDRARLESTLQRGLALGLVPILGDVLQAIFKTNTRNVNLIEQALVRKSLDGVQFS